MATKDAFAGYCAELLSGLGAVRVRRMFGGHGLYVDDLFIAIVVGETLYLKADAGTLPRFEAAGCAPFTYTAKGNKRVSLSYRAVPAEAMDSPALMRPWAALALEAALRARGK
jgi:DNA transformation protein and related proteins